jgi:transcriptional regulator with PAS, ATPase and Fis domain
MSGGEWWQGIAGSVTVCDVDGIIVAMNDASAATFARDGGRALIGRSLLDCHPGASRDKVAALLAEQRANSYITEKAGRCRFVHQAPWYRDGRFAGLVEIIVDIPAGLPHHKRD